MNTQALFLRIKAFFIDYLFILGYLIGIVILSLSIEWIIPNSISSLFSSPFKGQIFAFLFVTAPVSGYFVYTESSTCQGSFGKSKIGIQVIDYNGDKISPRSSVIRTLVKFIPWEISHTLIWQSDKMENSALILMIVVIWTLLGINAFLIVSTKDNQSLYDIVSKSKISNVNSLKR